MTPAPFINLLPVDSTRIGGSFATQRHAFSIVPHSPVPASLGKPAIEPPPKRVLAQGPIVVPRLSQAQASEIQEEFGTLADALELELEAVKAEADMVSGPTLRVEPDLYKSIAIVGPYLTPQEIRNVLILDARALGSIAERVLTGSASQYLTEAQRAKLNTAKSDATTLIDYIQQFDLSPLGGAASRVASEHTATHTKAVGDLSKAVERTIVAAEASSVPVREPMETGSPWGALLVLGTLVAVGVLISELA